MNQKKLTIEGAPPLSIASETLATRRWPYVAYFLGVPLIVAVYAALNNWEIRQIAGVNAALVFYIAHALPPWCLTCLSTTITKRALARWQPAWPLLLLIGHLLGSFLIVPYSNWLTSQYEFRFPELSMAGEVAPLFSVDFWMYLLRAGVIWFGINFLFDRFLGVRLYRYEKRTASNSDPTAATIETQSASQPIKPALFSRLPENIEVADLVAIKAEQHYIQVITTHKQFMVLYRFSDAIRELPPELGVQVHRSYWVNAGAIDSVHAKAKDFFVRMNTGTLIPVSGPYQGMVRELARAKGMSKTN